jgi:outer membrane protein assembly factor BamB
MHRSIQKHQHINRYAVLGLLALVLSIVTFGAGSPVTEGARGTAPNAAVTLSPVAFLPLVMLNRASTPTPAPTPPPPCKSPASTGAEWPMVAANAQRTSWTPEEVRCNLNVEWYHPIEPYIPYKVQPIAANGSIYVSTAKGLYAFRASDGALLWVYPTELPLGNSPTIATVNGESVAYVGGYDRQIHAIDANTGVDILGYTPYLADAGFETNPLVIQDSYTNNVPTIFAGNRDGYFFAFNAQTGALVWKYQTAGPILFSAAYKDGIVYFASNDDYAYALNASNGSLVWKSGKFPGQGFQTFWPVIYTNKSTGKDYVVLATGENYRQNDISPVGNYAPALVGVETELFYANNPNQLIGPTGTVPGDWAPGTVSMDASIITKYYANQPYRRTVFFLSRSTGQEYTFTDPVTGKPTYAPFSWSGVTHGGVRYPPIVNGVDGVLYEQTAYYNGGWVSRGGPAGWKFGTQYISEVAQAAGNPDTTASDEPSAFSSGGRIVYRSLCCDRRADGFDITVPYGQNDSTGNKRYWTYFGYNLNSIAPDYDQMYNDGTSSYTGINGYQEYTGTKLDTNGIYGKHGTDQSPAVPYQQKLFFLRGNSLIAFSSSGGGKKLPLATVVAPQAAANPLTVTDVSQRLTAEIQKMLAAGHLQPGYHHAGIIDTYGRGGFTDDKEYGEIFDYFDNPSDTVVTLLAALPYLSSTTQSQVKTYLQTNYGPGTPYDLTRIVHIGWNTGASRMAFDIPDDVRSLYSSGTNPRYSKRTTPYCGGCGYWQWFSPYNFYAAWKYAQGFGNNAAAANTILTAMSNNGHPTPEAPTPDATLLLKPHWMNQYLAGYLGYLNLLQLAGKPDDPTIRGYYNHLLSLRTANFSKDWPTAITNQEDPKRAISVMRNFLYMTPEIGDYMSKNISSVVLQQAVDEYTYLAPYWFVSKFDNSYNESTLEPLYDYPALFQAKAYILKQHFSELAKYIDAPAFETGDLFYIQNLVAALNAPP